MRTVTMDSPSSTRTPMDEAVSTVESAEYGIPIINKRISVTPVTAEADPVDFTRRWTPPAKGGIGAGAQRAFLPVTAACSATTSCAAR